MTVQCRILDTLFVALLARRLGVVLSIIAFSWLRLPAWGCDGGDARVSFAA